MTQLNDIIVIIIILIINNNFEALNIFIVFITLMKWICLRHRNALNILS